jgi:cytochrome c oxidase subunit 2
MNNAAYNPIGLGSYWLPRQSSTLAPTTDFAWSVVSWVSAFFFVLIIGAMVVFMLKYKRKSDRDVTSLVDHNLTIEVAWTVLPLALCIVLFVVGFRGYVSASVAPGNALEIRVTGMKWQWQMTYPNGTSTINELRVPAGRPVKLVLSSKDVIHSFYVPEFRIKQDAVPGLYTTTWFEAEQPVDTVVECTEYCGNDHSNMLANLYVMEPAKFEEWLDKAGNEGADIPPAEYGKKLYSKVGCETCHSTDGSIKQAPSFQNLFEKREKLADGTEVAVDENYLRESILNPTAKVVAGFQPIMPAFQGVLKDREVDALIAFIKTLKK